MLIPLNKIYYYRYVEPSKQKTMDDFNDRNIIRFRYANSIMADFIIYSDNQEVMDITVPKILMDIYNGDEVIHLTELGGGIVKINPFKGYFRIICNTKLNPGDYKFHQGFHDELYNMVSVFNTGYISIFD